MTLGDDNETTSDDGEAKVLSLSLVPRPGEWHDLEDIDDATVDALRDIDQVRAYTASPDPASSFHAAVSLRDIRRAANTPVTAGRGAPTDPTKLDVFFSWAARRGAEGEAVLRAKFDAVTSERLRRSPWSVRWTLGRLLVTTAISVAIITDHTFVAFLLLSLRLGVSIATGTSWSFPAEVRDARHEHTSAFGCLSGHVSDAMVLLAMSLQLLLHGRTAWGFVLVVALVAQLLATLLRVAVLQFGLRMHRLRLERLLRAGSVWLALGVGSWMDWAIPQDGVPMTVVLVGASTLAFAAIEVLRTYATARTSAHLNVSVLVGGEEVYSSSERKLA